MQTFVLLLSIFNEIFASKDQICLILDKFWSETMKAVILTSSIFYLLGLKVSQNIEATPKELQDANPAPVKQEQVIEKPVAEKSEEQKTLYTTTPQKETPTMNSDSGFNSVVRQKSTHLMEKMD